MEKEELNKYIDFVVNPGPFGDIDKAHEEAVRRWGDDYTFMVGHQPGLDADGEIDFRDPYWTDDVTNHLDVDVEAYVKGSAQEWDEGTLNLFGEKYDVLEVNDCGFCVLYGPKEIIEAVK